MKRVMLIVNPYAGKRQIRIQLCAMIEKLNNNGLMPTVFTTDPKFGARKIVENYSDDFDMIICCGGDGTLNQVISSLLKKEKRPPIGYIPAGTANDVATTFELTSDALRGVDNILAAKPMPFDVGVFGNSNFIYIASFGAFTDVSYSTPQEQKNALGQLAYILNGVKSVSTIKSYHLRVETEDAVYEDDYVFGAMINSLSFAGMFKLNQSDVRFDDGMFEVMLIKTPKTPLQLQLAATCLLKRNYDDRYVNFFHASKIRVISSEPIPWTTDGEFGDVHKVATLGVSKQAVQLLINPNERRRSIVAEA